MLKRFLIIFTFALLLAACDLTVDPGDDGKEKGKSIDSVAVGFQAYVNRATKAGETGDLTTIALKTAGFGVFGYYGGSSLYDETLKPEFMYNQKVAYDETTNQWTYKPIKFWPNEHARLTFFAYAPHVAVTSSTGAVSDNTTTGIIGTINKDTQGDPQVKYSASLTPGQGVDLCWAEPYIDKVKQSANERIDFLFNHALAQLNVQIDTDVDVESHNASTLDAGTHIYVRSVSFTGFTTRGSLNLNSPANNPVWRDLSGTGVLKRDPVTIYDGRSDGYEGMTTGVNPNEEPATLNPVLVQSEPYSDSPTAGVTNAPVNLFNGPTAESPLMVIPVPGAPLTVTIVYDVETADGKMQDYLSDGVTPGLSMENRITRTIQLDDGSNMFLFAGKRYVLSIHLGLTSVKCDATVGEWVDSGDTPGPYVPPGPVSLGSVKFTQSELTKWIGESVTSPSLLIRADDGSSLAGATGLTVRWSSHSHETYDVATIDENTGAITLVDAGVTDITATVSYEGATKATSYILNVNKVTGISFDPASVAIVPGNKEVIIASLTHTTNGSVANWPMVSWETTNTAFSLNPVSSYALRTNNKTTVETEVTAPDTDGATTTLTATVDNKFTSSSISASAIVKAKTETPTFRGYQVSKGFLKRIAEDNYIRDDEVDPLIAGYMSGINSSQSNRNAMMNTYYHQFSRLQTELGSEDGLIKVTNVDLDGWVVPSVAEWNTILYGAPLKDTYVNGVKIEKNLFAVANFTYYKSGGYTFSALRCLILIPDGANIEMEGLVMGANNGQPNASANFFQMAQNDDNFNKLLKAGCVLIPCATGYIKGDGGRPAIQNTYGYIRTSSSKTAYIFWSSSNTTITINVGNDPRASDDYYPVKLVKKVDE